MNRFFLLCAAAVIMTLAADAFAREIDVIAVETRGLPARGLKDPDPNSNEAEWRVRTSASRVRVGFPPVKTGTSGLLSFGVGFETLRFSYEGPVDPAIAALDAFHTVSASAFYRKPLSKPRWNLQAFFRPAICSDFAALTTRALRIECGMFALRELPGGGWSLGLVLLNDFGRPRMFPAVGYEGVVHDRHRFTVRLPTQLSWSYVGAKKWEAGVAARVSGDNFRIEESGPYRGKNVAYSIFTVGPNVLIRLTTHLRLAAESGMTLYHKFDIREGNHNRRDLDLDNAPFLALSLRAGF
jgi:hypothetical protein